MGAPNRLLKWGRLLAFGSVILFVALVILFWAGLIDQDRANPVVGAVVLFFFLGVAAYAGGFARAMTADGTRFETSTSLATWARVPGDSADSYERSEQSVYAAGMGLWAALIVGFVVAVAAGILFGDVGGWLGFGLGSLVVLAAGTGLIRAYYRMARARADVWAHLGRHRWTVGLYLVGCFVLALLWIKARAWLHGTPLQVLGGGIVLIALVALRNRWRDLW